MTADGCAPVVIFGALLRQGDNCAGEPLKRKFRQHLPANVIMFRTCLITISLLSFISAQPGLRSEAKVTKTITFEGVLLANSPYPNVGCGGSWFHQLAKYRVEKVLKGVYASKELVVDHAACWGDVFAGIPVGSRVRLTVTVRKNYHTITVFHGIREVFDMEELSDAPKIFYVSVEPPTVIRGLR